MADKFSELVAILNASPSSTNDLWEITVLLQQQTDASLPSFTSQASLSLVTLNQWTWQLLSQDFHQWINEPYHQEICHTLAVFNRKIIFNYDNIEVNRKASFLFPETTNLVKQIFQQIEQNTDENNSFITIVSLYLDNQAYFLHDNPQYDTSPVIDHIGRYIVDKYVISKEYKQYLTQLRQPQLSQAVFTAKLLFYIRTCSFYASTRCAAKLQNLSYGADEIIGYLNEDYLQIIHEHSYTVTSWNKELLGCIAHLISFVCGICWWDGEKRTQVKILFPTEQIVCDHVQDLIRIVDYRPFYKQIKPARSNDVTTMIDATFVLLLITVQTQNINWFFRSNAAIRDAIVVVCEAALNDETCLCGYGILGESLADEDLKALKIADHISGYFFHVLEEAWHHPCKTFKHVPLVYLLRGFQNLSKNDCIQQRTSLSGKISLFIEMCDQYPVVFDIIWALSFNEDIQDQLRSNSSFMSKLTHHDKEFDDERMRKMTHGILWNLENNHEDRPVSDTNNKNPFDIMISYSHKDKSLCKQIYDQLIIAGYRVWIDFDQMHGNVMDAMAQAIECSQTVIICMSEQYRKSNYCRAEAHYAFQRQRKIVPVLLQKHYKPDGWLLFLIGQLLYIDFNKHEFNRAMKMLLTELKVEETSETNVVPVHPKEDTQTIVSVTTISMPKVSLLSTMPPGILEWTPTQVQEWLVEHKLMQMSRLLTDCDGRSLVYFNKYMKNGQIPQILNLLQEDSLRRINESISLIEISRFHSLMDQEKRLLQSIIPSRLTKLDIDSGQRDT